MCKFIGTNGTEKIFAELVANLLLAASKNNARSLRSVAQFRFLENVVPNN
jgi:hypothetical protein